MKTWIEDRQEMEEILQKANVGRLGLADGEEPYIVPLNFVYESGNICFHTGLEGRKLDIMKKNPRVCFEVDEMMELVVNEEAACLSTAYYRSVIAWGTVRTLEASDEKLRVLDVLMKKYAKGRKYEPIAEHTLPIVTVFEIKVDKMTGKANLREDLPG